jgi:hypothetical protein
MTTRIAPQHQDRHQDLPHSHRANRRRVPGKRRIYRLGLLATAALGTVGTAAGAAQALAIGDGFASDSSGFAVAHTTSFALSTAHDRTSFRDSFTIHQFGEVTAAHVRNEATAESVACSPNAPCRAVSLSFQIVTMAGSDIHLNAVNLGNATNQHCAGCQTVAGAYQFVVDTPRAFTLSAAAKAQLAAIHRELDALSNAKLTVTEVQSKADALAGQVAAILMNAAATAPTQGKGGQGGPVMHPLTSSGLNPTVKVFRDFQQH